jgi:hypothetical protein
VRVYVAAPYTDAEEVRAIHAHLRMIGCSPTSQWASQALGPEDFSLMTPDQIADIAHANDRDVLSSQMVLVVARAGAGGEMFAEARFASYHRIPIVWVGRLTLSAWRKGVTRCVDVVAALRHIAECSGAGPERSTSESSAPPTTSTPALGKRKRS